MARCSHATVCHRSAEVEAASPVCILHSTDAEKDVDAFREALAAHRDQRGDDFSYVVFPAGIQFREVHFSRSVSFREAQFLGDVSFAGAVFEGEASFLGTRFRRGVNASGVAFQKRAAFSDARFDADADFSGAQFKGSAHFAGASFGDWTSFVEATFGGVASLHQVRFQGPVTFYESVFAGDLQFDGGVAASTVAFSRVRFDQRATFSGTEFRGRLDLSQATFGGETIFEGRGNAPLLFDGIEVNFRDASFGYYSMVFIRNADLRRCQFLDTDLRNVEFTSVRWPRINRGVCVYDELLSLDQRAGEMPWGQLARLYRELKQNYEDRRNYLRSGDFHYREKEMQRRNPEMPWNHRALLWIYWGLSGYGERVLPPLGWLMGLITGSALLYILFGATLVEADDPLSWRWMDGWHAVYYSLRVSLLQNPSELLLRPVSQFVHTAQIIFSPILIGLLALAIRQRVKR
jgi:uncharacterized protein YjbI with pentapeptide repeats